VASLQVSRQGSREYYCVARLAIQDAVVGVVLDQAWEYGRVERKVGCRGHF
jgi:hypothetical protein